MMRFDPARQRAMEAASLSREAVLADDPAGFFEGAFTAPLKGAVAGAGETSALLYGGAASLVRGYNQVLGWQDELTNLAGLPKSGKVDTAWLDKQRDAALNTAHKYKPDPVATGMAGQVLFDLSRILTQVGAGAVAAAATGGSALAGGAALTGSATTLGKFDELKKAGIDEATALQVAAIEGLTTGAGVVVPAALGQATLARAGIKGAKSAIGANVAYGGGANIGMGITQRATSYSLLEQNGYADMAAHYEPLQAQALIAEGALGAIFGVVGAKAGLPYRAGVVRDAALAATNARHAALDTAPGIPADPATAATHSRALNEAMEQVLGGKAVHVADTGIDHGRFVSVSRHGVQPESNAASVADSRVRELLALDDAPLVLQNRNRASSASIAQMNAIAAQPDYMRAGISRSMAEGAPVVFGNADVLPDSAVMGRSETITDGTGARVQTRYAVVQADDILTSNLADGTPVAAYTEGQTGKLRTAAGNGRAAGLRAAHERGTADRYRSELRADAHNIGIDADAMDAMRHPVLVRVMNQADVRPDIGDTSNIAAGAVLSPVEQATNDARRVKLAALEFDEHGTPTPETLRAFVAAMPQTERTALMNPDGSPTRQAQERIMAAAFRQAYGIDELVRLFAQAIDAESRTVMAALANVAGRMAQLAGAGEFDLRELVAQAAVMAVNARRRGVKLTDLVRQTDLDTDPQVFAIVDFMARHIRSGKKISEGLRRMIDAAGQQIDILHANETQGSMFGAQPVLTRAQVLDTLKDVEPQTAALTPQARAELLQRFETAGRVKPRFDAALEKIAQDTGATLHTADIKSVARAVEKVLDDYNGDAARIKDLVRATLIVKDAAQLEQVLQRVRRVLAGDVKRNNLVDEARTSPTGYRDALIEVNIDGFTVELQISTPEMMEAKKKAHPLYVKQSKIERAAIAQGRIPSAAEEAEIKLLVEQQREIYAPAWDATKARNSASLSNDPLWVNELYGNRRPSGTSHAVDETPTADTGTSSTSANNVPSGNDSGSLIAGMEDTSFYDPAWEATKARNLDSSRGAPLRENESQGNDLPPGTSQAMHSWSGVRDTGISSTSANRVPSGNESGSSMTGMVEPPESILPLTAARAGDDIETRAGLALLQEKGDMAVPVALDDGEVVHVPLQEALIQADSEVSTVHPDTLAAAVRCGITRGV